MSTKKLSVVSSQFTIVPLKIGKESLAGTFYTLCHLIMHNDSLRQGACMEFILRHKLLDTLYTAGKNNVSSHPCILATSEWPP